MGQTAVVGLELKCHTKLPDVRVVAGLVVVFKDYNEHVTSAKAAARLLFDAGVTEPVLELPREQGWECSSELSAGLKHDLRMYLFDLQNPKP
jgi:hypothetical protein